MREDFGWSAERTARVSEQEKLLTRILNVSKTHHFRISTNLSIRQSKELKHHDANKYPLRVRGFWKNLGNRCQVLTNHDLIQKINIECKKEKKIVPTSDFENFKSK
jgi:hypothetical protein